MSRRLLCYVVPASLLLLPLALGVAGCGTSARQDTAKGATAAAPSASDPGCCPALSSKPEAKFASQDQDPDVAEDLAKLPPQDRTLAEKQKICPVTDTPLGSMGVPVKVNVKGQTVFLCCAGCEGKLQKNPDKYLAKLNVAASK